MDVLCAFDSDGVMAGRGFTRVAAEPALVSQYLRDLGSLQGTPEDVARGAVGNIGPLFAWKFNSVLITHFGGHSEYLEFLVRCCRVVCRVLWLFTVFNRVWNANRRTITSSWPQPPSNPSALPPTHLLSRLSLDGVLRTFAKLPAQPMVAGPAILPGPSRRAQTLIQTVDATRGVGLVMAFSTLGRVRHAQRATVGTADLSENQRWANPSL